MRGVDSMEETITMLRFDIQRSIVPPLEVTFTPQYSEGRQVLLLQVPRGADRPYMFEPAGQIYLRQEADSVPATRDDIVRLVLEAHAEHTNAELAAAALSVPTTDSAAAARAIEQADDLQRRADRGGRRGRLRAARPRAPPQAAPPSGWGAPRRCGRRGRGAGARRRARVGNHAGLGRPRGCT